MKKKTKRLITNLQSEAKFYKELAYETAEDAVSETTFNASPDWTTNFAPPSNTCKAEPAGIGASLTK